MTRETSTFAVLLAKYSFGHSTLDFDVRTLQSCKKCHLKVHTPMHSIVAREPLEVIAIDFTVLEPASNGIENVLVTTDVYSKLTYVYNVTPHSATGFSPFYLMFSRVPRLPVDIRLHRDDMLVSQVAHGDSSD